MDNFSFRRAFSVSKKEALKVRRSYRFLVMLFVIPMVLLFLNLESINLNPKHAKTAVLDMENNLFTQRILAAMQQSEYFDIAYYPKTEQEARKLMDEGKVLLIVQFPTDFTRDLIRGKYPQVLLQANGINPVAVLQPINILQEISRRVLNPLLTGPLASLQPKSPPFEVISHLQYSPERKTTFFIGPHIIGLVLSFTLILLTINTLLEEFSEGTIESLLISPLRVTEILVGKVVPYIFIGYMELGLMLPILTKIYDLPIRGSIILLLLCSFLFILANLSVGLVISSFAKNIDEAEQLFVLFILPSLILSGFFFPFHGMPIWAQWIGNLLPLTHYIRITEGIMLKGYSYDMVWSNSLCILIFFMIALFFACVFFNKKGFEKK